VSLSRTVSEIFSVKCVRQPPRAGCPDCHTSGIETSRRNVILSDTAAYKSGAHRALADDYLWPSTFWQQPTTFISSQPSAVSSSRPVITQQKQNCVRRLLGSHLVSSISSIDYEVNGKQRSLSSFRKSVMRHVTSSQVTRSSSFFAPSKKNPHAPRKTRCIIVSTHRPSSQLSHHSIYRER